MGYVVLHLDKSPGNEAAMTDDIERNIIPPNVDPTRTHLNKKLIEFPEGVKDRTEAIEYRLKHAKLERQIGKNQVKVIRFMLTGSLEDMKRIEDAGKLDDWCRDNIDWLKKNFGEENVVAATLHLDEQTPHIHASVVPIVRGERRNKTPRKKKSEESQEQKKARQYKKKNPNRPRLCVDDIITRIMLVEYQDAYAGAMAKYGLERGIKGSDARHITSTEYHRSKNLQIDIGLLLAEENAKRQSVEELKRQEQEAKQQSIQAETLRLQKESELKDTDEALKQVKSQLKTEKLKNTAADVDSTIIEGIGSVIGTSKVKKQQQEIESLKTENENLNQEVRNLKRNIQTIQKEHESVVDKLKQELNRIYEMIPNIRELLRIEKLCRVLGFGGDLLKSILQCKPVGFQGELYSSEHQRHFKTEHSVAEIKEDPKEENKLQLTIDGVSDTNWCKQKYREFQEAIGIKHIEQVEVGKSKGFRR